MVDPVPAAAAVTTPAVATPAVTTPAATPAVVATPTPEAKPAETPAEATIIGEVEKKAEEVKPGEEKKPGEAEKKPEEKTEPIKYEPFKLPEGVTLEAEALASAQKFMSEELKLPQEQAQKLVDFHVDALKKEAEAPYQLWADTQKKWQDEVKADPTIGGDHLPAVKTRISKLLDEYGDPGVREALNFTGAGNHPAIIKTFAKLAEKLVEGSFVPGGGSAPVPKDAASVFYPNMKPQGT